MTAYWDRVFEPAIRLAGGGLYGSRRGSTGVLGKETALQQRPAREALDAHQEDAAARSPSASF